MSDLEKRIQHLEDRTKRTLSGPWFPSHGFLYQADTSKADDDKGPEGTAKDRQVRHLTERSLQHYTSANRRAE